MITLVGPSIARNRIVHVFTRNCILHVLTFYRVKLKQCSAVTRAFWPSIRSLKLAHTPQPLIISSYIVALSLFLCRFYYWHGLLALWWIPPLHLFLWSSSEYKDLNKWLGECWKWHHRYVCCVTVKGTPVKKTSTVCEWHQSRCKENFTINQDHLARSVYIVPNKYLWQWWVVSKNSQEKPNIPFYRDPSSTLHHKHSWSPSVKQCQNSCSGLPPV